MWLPASTLGLGTVLPHPFYYKPSSKCAADYMMAPVPNIFREYHVLESYQLALYIITVFNEVFLPFSQWIISPSKPPTQSYQSFFPRPLITAISYAIAEPVAYSLLALSPLPPTFAVIFISILAVQVRCHERLILKCQRILEAIARSGLDPETFPSNATQKIKVQSNPDAQKPPSPSRIRVTRTLVMPAIMIAASNAAVLLSSQSMAAALFEADETKRFMAVIIGAVGLVTYLVSRIMETSLAKVSHRAKFLSYNSVADVSTQLFYMAVLLAVKTAVRMLLGQTPFMAFCPVNSTLAIELFERENYTFLDSVYGKLPPWILSVSKPVQYLLLFVGSMLQGLAEEDIMAKHWRWADQHLDPIEVSNLRAELN